MLKNVVVFIMLVCVGWVFFFRFFLFVCVVLFLCVCVHCWIVYYLLTLNMWVLGVSSLSLASFP